MVEELLIGAGFAFAAAVQPGPLQAYLLASVTRNGWKRTLPASLSPLISDGPIALLSLIVLRGLPELARRLLQTAGGMFLLYLAWPTFRQWSRQRMTESKLPDSAPRTILQAATVNILNPNPYLGWSLVLGPAVIRAWQHIPANAVALIVAFYATLVIALSGTILAFGTTRFLGTGFRRALILISAIVLAMLGIYQLVSGVIGAPAS